MINWVRVLKKETEEGTTIVYFGEGTSLSIESRKRHIPHANRVGTWDHTSYWVLNGSEELIERHRMTDAKEYAEKYWESR